MSCGCVVDGDARKRMAIAATMCAVCVHREGGVTDPLTRCTVDGRPLLNVVAQAGTPAACVLGRHPDARGIVRLNDVEFEGLPFPVWLLVQVGWVRRRLRLWRPCPGAPAKVGLGCGCIRVLKVMWRVGRRKGCRVWGVGCGVKGRKSLARARAA